MTAKANSTAMNHKRTMMLSLIEPAVGVRKLPMVFLQLRG